MPATQFNPTLPPRGRLAEILARDSAVFVKRERSEIKGRQLFLLVCSCGVEFRKRDNAIALGGALCPSCSNERAYHQHRIEQGTYSIQERVESIAKEWGAVGLTSDYLNVHSRIGFICKCGEPARTSIRKVFKFEKMRCVSCFYMARPKGREHPSWNKEWDDAQRETRRLDRRARTSWQKRVFLEKGAVCVITGDSKNLCAHHKYGWSKYPTLRNSITNGVVLSRDVHRKYHQQIGLRNPATETTFLQFFAKEISLKWAGVCCCDRKKGE